MQPLSQGLQFLVGLPIWLLLNDHETGRSMSPLIGQVLVNNAVEILTVGGGSGKRARQNENKKESINVVFIETEKTNKESLHKVQPKQH